MFKLIVATLMMSVFAEQEVWMDKHLSSPIEYTVSNHVSIVHNTKISFVNFWKELEKFIKAN